MKANPKFYDAVPPEDDNIVYGKKELVDKTNINHILKKYPTFSLDFTTFTETEKEIHFIDVYEERRVKRIMVARINNKSGKFKLQAMCVSCCKEPNKLRELINDIRTFYNK